MYEIVLLPPLFTVRKSSCCLRVGGGAICIGRLGFEIGAEYEGFEVDRASFHLGFSSSRRGT